jgi:hypothetical protein
MRVWNRLAALMAAPVLFASLLAAAGEARGQIARLWNRPEGGFFNDAFNWDPFGIPGASDGAEFDLASTYPVNFGSDPTNGSAYVGAGNVTFDLNAGGAMRTYSPGRLDVIGSGGSNPKLLVRDGNVNASIVRVQNGGHLHIGPDQGTANVPVTVNVNTDLQVTSGALLTLYDFHSNHVLNANGDVLIDGATMRRVGGDSVSTGRFNLAAGRTMTVQNAGSFDHAGSFALQGSTLHVRSAGIGSMDGVNIATSGGAGSLIVEGAGSNLLMDLTFNPTGMQTWGAAGGAATVDVRNGAAAALRGGAYLAAQGGTTTSARVTIDGPGTTFTHAIVGAGQAVDQIVVGQASGGSAELTVRNGAVFSSDAGVAGGSRIIVNPTGRINVESGATFSAANIERAGGQFNMLGGTVRFNEFTGNLINQSGTLRAGHAGSGIAFLNGSYTQQPTASMKIDIAGVLPGEAERFVVVGNAVLGGTLDLALVDDFVPVIGNTFAIVQTQSGNVGGRFARVNGTLPLPGIGLAVTYSPTQVLVRASVPGDANLDNAVNLADFNLLAANFGQSGRTWVQGDFTGDGMVNLLDFNRLAGQFGVSASGPGVTAQDWSALAAVVPEPAALSLPALAAIAASFRQQRRRRR